MILTSNYEGEGGKNPERKFDSNTIDYDALVKLLPPIWIFVHFDRNKSINK